jgi:hypothetical protein
MAERVAFAFTVPKPECEAVITYPIGVTQKIDVSWPIPTEAEAYRLAKEVGAPGFWRLKYRGGGPRKV